MIELPSRLNDIDPTLDAPFSEDKLDRAPIASILKSIVESYSSSSCVLAINGEWGTGKVLSTGTAVLSSFFKQSTGISIEIIEVIAKQSKTSEY